MRLHRVSAMVVRHLYLFPKSLDRITDALFWPVIDILMWGLTGGWITAGNPQAPQLVLAILCALLFWRVVFQSSYEIGINLLEECWNKNLTNLMASPLTKVEWLAACFMQALAKLVVIVCVVSATVYLCYALNVFSLGPLWVVFFVELMVFGWTVGLFAAGMVLYFGLRGQALTWTSAFLLSPLCAVYFPVSMLPDWAQLLSKALPPSYVFEGMRSIVLNGQASPELAWQGAVLNLLYLGLGLWFCNSMFERCRRRGFDHVEGN